MKIRTSDRLAASIDDAEKRALRKRLRGRSNVDDRGCWIWTGTIHPSGYGYMTWHDYPAYTHRVSWAVHRGPIPRGKFVLHKCDERRCVNPDHLFLGTQQDNVDDMIAKQRNKMMPVFWGESNHKVKDGNDVVVEARRLRGEGVSQREVARRLHVSQSTVWRWVHRLTRSAA